MRITVPNPLGPPITFDTDRFSHISLPTSIPQTFRSSRRGHVRLALVAIFTIFMLIVSPSPPFPPTYTAQWKAQRSVPWLYAGVFPEGHGGRYVKFDTPDATGFNHQLQRVLLQHHLAILGNRSLAYEPVVQDNVLLPFRLTLPPWRSAVIPLSAFLATVTSGFERFYNTPRAVPVSYYRKICPPYKQHVLTLKSEEQPHGELELKGDGQSRVHQLQVELAGSLDGCVRVEGTVFDDAFFDSDAPLQMYDSFARSPVLAQFTFAPSVLEIINRVLPELAPESGLYDLNRAAGAVSSEPRRTPSMWKHILALHLRRGDGWEHLCEEKGRNSAPFVSFNKLPKLPGNENVPPPADMPEAARMGLYNAKCNPPILDIIGRARRMKRNHPQLKVVYILTDGPDNWVQEVKMWLLSDGWDTVWVGTNDLYPRWQDHELGVAVDMEVARRAGVFVGNGFSTTSSNIVLLRSRDGIHPDLTQFW